MDRKWDYSKIFYKSENLRDEVSRKDLTVKTLSESLSKITIFLNKTNSIGSTQKKLLSGRSFNLKILQKQVTIMV